MQEREEKYGRMSLYMPIDLFHKIRQRAKEQRRSASQVTILIIEDFFKQEQEIGAVQPTPKER